jgi:mono/diheme cytochrome c family protein
MSRRSDDALYDAIAAGGRIMGRSPRMPPFGETLSPREIRALVAHLRELCACAGPEWSRR